LIKKEKGENMALSKTCCETFFKAKEEGVITEGILKNQGKLVLVKEAGPHGEEYPKWEPEVKFCPFCGKKICYVKENKND
jgi:NADH pyrophosphatase NudC (nudix superfamily)